MKLTGKLRAGSLIITIVVSMIVSMICLFLLLNTYHNRNEEIAYRIFKRLDINMASGVQLILADTSAFSNGQIDSVDLFEDQSDSVITARYYWGVYNVASVKAFRHGRQRIKTFMYGSGASIYNEGCIYLADHKRPLYVVGSTTLEGKAYLSGSGINIAYINQRGYESGELIKGEIRRSEEQLPAIEPKRLAHLEGLMRYDSSLQYLDDLPDTLTSSFDSLSSRIYLHGNVNLDEQVLKNNIILTSDSSIIVGSDSKLDNIIICAPQIQVRSGFTGSVHLVARQLIIEPGCNLKYPSSLTVIGDSLIQEPASIKIGERSKVQGVVVGAASPKSNMFVFFEAAKGSIIEGNIYIQGFVDVKGKVFGSVATDFFIYKAEAMIYENHLVDVEINRPELFEGFAGTTIIPGFNNFQVIQWLY